MASESFFDARQAGRLIEKADRDLASYITNLTAGGTNANDFQRTFAALQELERHIPASCRQRLRQVLDDHDHFLPTMQYISGALVVHSTMKTRH